MNEQPKKTRGRPKTIQREHVIEVAMDSYWANGPNNVSVNEICKRADVSKPGLYREFGNEDGLQSSVLDTYCNNALSPLYNILNTEQPFGVSLTAVTTLFLQARSLFAYPRGCLLREMTLCHEQVGPLTKDAIVTRQQEAHDQYAAWIERAIDRGDITNDIPLEVAATYVDLQFGNAMTLIKRDESDEMVETLVVLAFSVFEKRGIQKKTVR